MMLGFHSKRDDQVYHEMMDLLIMEERIWARFAVPFLDAYRSAISRAMKDLEQREKTITSDAYTDPEARLAYFATFYGRLPELALVNVAYQAYMSDLKGGKYIGSPIEKMIWVIVSRWSDLTSTVNPDFAQYIERKMDERFPGLYDEVFAIDQEDDNVSVDDQEDIDDSEDIDGLPNLGAMGGIIDFDPPPLLDVLPPIIKGGEIRDRITVGHYRLIFIQEPESLTNFHYLFVMVPIDLNNPEVKPDFYITVESNLLSGVLKKIAAEADPELAESLSDNPNPFLTSYSGDAHFNLGNDEDWSDYERFKSKAISMVQARLEGEK
jgi:hypothetical protein